MRKKSGCPCGRGGCKSGPPADEAFMKEAVRQAKKAAAIGDVPIGCVIVKEGRIIPELQPPECR